MFFKNLSVYRLTEKVDFSLLEEALKTKQAKSPTYQEMHSYGFTAPFGKGEDAPLALVSQNFYLISTRKEERILPASVVKKELRKKVDEIEFRDKRKIYKKEKDQMKDELVQTLLPKTLTRENVIYAAIDPQQGLIYVDTASTSKAEELLSLLREVLGTLPIKPITIETSPEATMTHWLRTGRAENGFHILEDCELKDTYDEGGTIRCKRQDLFSEEILNHLRSGMIVTQLALSWHNKLSFTLDDKLVIKRIKFEEILLEEADKDGGDDAARFSASFVLMMLTFNEMLPSLLTALGGETKLSI